MIQGVLIVLLGYLLGSIPAAYVAGRLLKGIDIRRYGSGNVGGSNVFAHVAKWAVVPVGLFDIGKAALAVWIAQTLGLADVYVFFTAMAAIVGHAWSLYLGFTGGRAVSASMGTLCIVMPVGALFILLILGLGRLFKAVGLFNLLAMLGLPLLAWVLHKSDLALAVTLGIVVLTVIKRLEANRAPMPPGYSRKRVLVNRLLYDRDIDEGAVWIHQAPASEKDEREG